MTVFEDFWARLKFEVTEFVLHDWWDQRDAAINDGRDYLEKNKINVERWCVMLENGQYSWEDFTWLLAGTRDMADPAELRKRGMPKAELDRFVFGVINIVSCTTHDYYAKR